VSCGETADPIDIQFGTKTQVSQGNSVLGGARISQGKGQLSGLFPPFKCIVTARAAKIAVSTVQYT